MAQGRVRFDFTKLNNLVRSLTETQVVKVGLFGEKASRTKPVVRKQGRGRRPGKEPEVMTNAEVGFAQEFGMPQRHIPARSFLRMPLFQKSGQIGKVLSHGAGKTLTDGKPKALLNRLGIAAVQVINAAFETHGFGSWKENAESTIRRKGSSAPLIDTGQLRRAVMFKVEDR